MIKVVKRSKTSFEVRLKTLQKRRETIDTALNSLGLEDGRRKRLAERYETLDKDIGILFAQNEIGRSTPNKIRRGKEADLPY